MLAEFERSGSITSSIGVARCGVQGSFGAEKVDVAKFLRPKGGSRQFSYVRLESTGVVSVWRALTYAFPISSEPRGAARTSRRSSPAPQEAATLAGAPP